MIQSGFSLTGVSVINGALPAATLAMGGGLNVVAGASDTGKSYVVALLDFMMGREEPPKDVPESRGYSTALLGMKDSQGTEFVLERGLRGGDLRHHESSLKDWKPNENAPQLGWKHNPKKNDTVSWLLLSLCGLENAVVLAPKGKTRPMSFRDVCHLILIDEVRIIDEWSPVYPNRQWIKQTEEKSVFNILLSGEDAKGVIAKPDLAIRRAVWRARREVIDGLISELERNLVDSGTAAETEKRLAEVDNGIELASAKLAGVNDKITGLSRERQASWETVQQARARIATIDGLLERFRLLALHYESDVQRLRFIAEGEHYLSQLGQAHCPICGSTFDEHETHELLHSPTVKSLQAATLSEIAKIELLEEDLRSTQAQLASERGVVRDRQDRAGSRTRDIETQIREGLSPQVTLTKDEISKLFRARVQQADVLKEHSRLAELRERRLRMGTEPKKSESVSDSPAPRIDLKGRREFANIVEDLLRAWHLRGVGTVEFDEKLDIVINGQARHTHGKGVRAIIHAAFTIGLMRYCKTNGLRHPYVVILDSPLTSYKAHDSYEADEDVQLAFWNTLATTPDDEQIIIFENKEPPPDVAKRIHYTHFSGKVGVGRVGFFPPLNGGVTKK